MGLGFVIGSYSVILRLVSLPGLRVMLVSVWSVVSRVMMYKS